MINVRVSACGRVSRTLSVSEVDKLTQSLANVNHALINQGSSALAVPRGHVRRIQYGLLDRA